MKKQRSADEQLIQKLETKVDEFEKGIDKRVKEKDEEIFNLELKLEEALA